AVNEPFVDLILEANWSSGRIVRDYTMLFDPPNLRQGSSSQAPSTAQVSPVSPPAPAVGAPVARMPAAPAAAPAGRASARAPASSAPAPAVRGPATEGGQRVTVQSGDTAGKIAATYKPATISLDQMLVALLRANPDAFIGGNVNRLKSGAVLEVPDADQAASTAAGEASQTVIAQSRDFNEFRRRLAEGSTPTVAAAPDRSASGRVQTQVEDRKPTAAAPDKLQLSKGAVRGKAAEEKIARDRADQEAKTRVAELNKNIADLNKLGSTPVAPVASAPRAPGVPVPPPVAGAPGPAAPAAVTSPASAPRPPVAATPSPAPAPVAPVASPASAARPAPAPAVVVPAPVPVTSAPAPAPVVVPPPVVAAPVVTAPPAADPASAATASPALSSASAASAPAAVAVVPTPVVKTPVPPAPVESSLIDDLLGNPIVPAAAGGLLALLLGFGFYRARQRKKSAQVDSSFLESRLQPDSFFGASGGQRIDTAEGSSVTGSSMVYSPSQLDAAGDVDPVAEADVYLAYGRDLQAEEILKEALRTSPQRVAIHSKLLEIYSKRRDGKAFELAATEAYNLTHGEGPDWEHICALGQELDPGNPLYRPGGQPMDGSAAAVGGMAAAGAFNASGATQPMPIETQPGAVDSVDLDLDLDFSLGDEPPRGHAFTSEPTVALKTVPLAAAPKSDFGATTVSMNTAPPVPEMPMLQATQPVTALEAPNLTLPDGSFDFNPEPARAPAAPAADSGMIEFDLGALSLDLDKPAASRDDGPGSTAGALLTTAGAPLSPATFDDTGGDPLATKLALAEEFNAIGDADGARSLAEEVRSEASGDLKGRAERFLAELG
ncbi:MAG: fimbrial protein FimV, partial [Haliea sp.]